MRPPEDWRRARATLAFAGLIACAYAAVALVGAGEWATIWGGFIPARLAFGGDQALAPFWLTPLTATLLHGGLFHVGFNLLILLFCGRPVENVLGPQAIIILFLVGAYAAAGAQYVAGPSTPQPMIGASGAISAIIGAYSMLFGRNKVQVANHRLALWLNALWLMVAWVVLQAIVGYAFSGGGVQVAVAAHVGGFAAGVLLANPLLLWRYRRA